MTNQLKVGKLRSVVLAEIGAGVRREAEAMGRYADRARAVSFAVLAADLHATKLRLAGLAERLESISRRPKPEAVE